MDSEAKINEHEVYSRIKSLANFLTTKIEVTNCTWEMQVRDERAMKWVAKETEGFRVRVIIRNTAPIENGWPLIVFTGLGLILKQAPISLRRLKKEGNLKIDLTNASQENPFPNKGTEREDELDYPHLTDAERKQGHSLFPGQSVTYDLMVASKKCPDVNDLKIMVEGNVSRRHLFHFVKELEVKQKS